MGFEKIKEYWLYLILLTLWLWLLIIAFLWYNSAKEWSKVYVKITNQIIDWATVNDTIKDKSTIWNKIINQINSFNFNDYSIDSWYITYSLWEDLDTIILNENFTNDISAYINYNLPVWKLRLVLVTKNNPLTLNWNYFVNLWKNNVLTDIWWAWIEYIADDLHQLTFKQKWFEDLWWFWFWPFNNISEAEKFQNAYFSHHSYIIKTNNSWIYQYILLMPLPIWNLK